MARQKQNTETGLMEDAAATAKPKRAPDQEFGIIRRIQRALLMLPSGAARRRVLEYVQSRADDSAPELPTVPPHPFGNGST